MPATVLNSTQQLNPIGYNGLRLTLDSSNPVSQSDQTAKSTVYWLPYMSDQIMLYTGTLWASYKTKAMGLVLSGLTSDKNYDIFAFASSATPSSTDTGTDTLTFASATGWTHGASIVPNATVGGLTAGTTYWYRPASSTTGTLHDTLAGAIANTGKINLTASVTASLLGVSLELSAAWTDDTNRSGAITQLDGVNVKSGATTRRYIGTLRSTATTTTEDSETKRFLYNYDNRVTRKLKKLETTGSWVYNTASWREINGATNRVSWVDGSGEAPIDLHAQAMFAISTASTYYVIGIGYDSTSTSTAELGAQCGGLAGLQAVASARLLKTFPFGHHYAAAIENTPAAAGNVTIYSNDARFRTGILGTILN